MISSWLVDEYNKRLETDKKKFIKWWIYIILFFLLLSIPFTILFNRDVIFVILFFVCIGQAALSGLITLFMMKAFVSEKPLYQFLYPKVVEDLNFNDRLSLTYEAYPQNKDFIKNGRLFSPNLAKTIRYKISVNLRSGHQVDLYDAYLYTQSNNSTIVYLDGFYMVQRSPQVPVFQLRSGGHPVGKETHYVRLQNRTGPKEFVDEKGLGDVEDKYYRIYERLLIDFQSKKAYLSGVKDTLHLAVNVKKLPRRVKTLNQESYDQLKNTLISVVSTLEAIDQE